MSQKATKLKLKQVFFLKLTSFHPQIIAPMETKLSNGTINNVQNIVGSGIAVEKKLNIELCNAIEHNISRGMVASIQNGWHEEKFTFILVVEVYDGNNIIAEEIYQGYTDNSEVAGGRIENGGVVSLNPNMTMFVNKLMTINYRTNEFGARVPVLNKPSNILVNNNNSVAHNTGLVLNRPMDVTMRYYADEMVGMGEGNMDIAYDTANYNGTAKLSLLANDSAGNMVTTLVKAADRARREAQYVFSSNALTNYEGMLDVAIEENINSYYLLKEIGSRTSRISVSNFTVGELAAIFGNEFQPYVSTLSSYNDIITKNTNKTFNFNGINDKGDSTTNDNQITRFQKKVIPAIFDKMLSHGYIAFSGVLTNRVMDRKLHINHSVLINVSETINTNPRISNDVFRMLYESLTTEEFYRLISGDADSFNEVTMVFDLDINSSVVQITINGNTSTVRIPSMADGLFTSVISTEENSMLLAKDLRNVVDTVIKTSNDVVNSNSSRKSMWE